MAGNLKLTVKTRSTFGKGASRQLRRDGQIPAVLYGHNQDPIHVSLPTTEFAAILRKNGTNAVMELDIEGKEQLVLTKQVDVHPIRDYIEHADLMIIKKGEKVTVEVPIEPTGTIAPGGMLIQDVTVVEIEADALSIPENLSVSIDGKEIGQQVLAKDIPLPEGVTLVSDPDLLIINVVEPEVQDTEPELAADTEETTAEEATEAAEEATEE